MILRGESMEKSDISASIQESILRNELLRVRNTYSFRLGFLLTESLFRKPWLLLFLPFRFLKMNYDFWTDKKSFTRNSEVITNGSHNSECLLLFVASEGGRAACERAKEIAGEWLNEYRHHLVIVSSNSGMIGFNQPNLSLYIIPDPKSKKNISRSDWNKSCENVLYRAIFTHLPANLIFDGPYPYRGVLNALSSAPEMKSVWVQSERTNAEVIKKTATYFTEIRKMNYLENSNLAKNNSKRNYHSLTNNILLATGYGSHEELQKVPSLILKALSNYENINIIGVESLTNSKGDSRITELWNDVVANPNMGNLQAAIVSDNIELITKLHSLMIPTLCVLHKKTTNDAKKVIYSLCASGTLFVTYESEKDEIELYIQALLNREWNLSISQRGTSVTKPNWIKQFIQS